MKLLIDECVHKNIAERLRKSDFDIVYVADIELSTEDDNIIRIANKENRIIITDDKDFGELIYRQNLISRGIVLLRFNPLEYKIYFDYIIKQITFNKDKLENNFVVIDKNKIRIRPLYKK